MIKAVIFDMDGVLIDAKEWHYQALNRALALFGFTITPAEHLMTFDGLPTRRKLEILTATKSLPEELHDFINRMKQEYTIELIHGRCRPVFAHEYALAQLRAQGYRLAVASNSVRLSVDLMMAKANLSRFLDLSLSNEDVSAPKPSPEIYLTAMRTLGVVPSETLVIEDNENGIRAALDSGAHFMKVREVTEVTLDNIRDRIARIERQVPA